MPADSQAFLTEWKGQSLDGNPLAPTLIYTMTYVIQRSSSTLEMEAHYVLVF
jgi:hypothetical protein